jgi:hypothetical protein
MGVTEQVVSFHEALSGYTAKFIIMSSGTIIIILVIYKRIVSGGSFILIRSPNNHDAHKRSEAKSGRVNKFV